MKGFSIARMTFAFCLQDDARKRMLTRMGSKDQKVIQEALALAKHVCSSISTESFTLEER
jgi:hypothetical protein